MDSELKQYNITFLYYDDEGCDYFDTAMLTVDEAAKLTELLETVEKSGNITRSPGVPFVYEPCQPGRYADVRAALLEVTDIQYALNDLIAGGIALPAAAEGYVDTTWSEEKD